MKREVFFSELYTVTIFCLHKKHQNTDNCKNTYRDISKFSSNFLDVIVAATLDTTLSGQH